jgi:hypothetical protein
MATILEQIKALLAQLTGTLAAPDVADGFVYLPATGHTLPLPQAHPTSYKDGEMFPGYVGRVADACGQHNQTVVSSALGSLYQTDGAVTFRRTGGWTYPDVSNWPKTADEFWNPRAYMTPDELADDQKRVTTWQEWDNPENIARRERQMKEAIANHRPRGPRDGR